MDDIPDSPLEEDPNNDSGLSNSEIVLSNLANFIEIPLENLKRMLNSTNGFEINLGGEKIRWQNSNWAINEIPMVGSIEDLSEIMDEAFHDIHEECQNSGLELGIRIRPLIVIDIYYDDPLRPRITGSIPINLEQDEDLSIKDKIETYSREIDMKLQDKTEFSKLFQRGIILSLVKVSGITADSKSEEITSLVASNPEHMDDEISHNAVDYLLRNIIFHNLTSRGKNPIGIIFKQRIEIEFYVKDPRSKVDPNPFRIANLSTDLNIRLIKGFDFSTLTSKKIIPRIIQADSTPLNIPTEKDIPLDKICMAEVEIFKPSENQPQGLTALLINLQSRVREKIGKSVLQRNLAPTSASTKDLIKAQVGTSN